MAVLQTVNKTIETNHPESKAVHEIVALDNVADRLLAFHRAIKILSQIVKYFIFIFNYDFEYSAKLYKTPRRFIKRRIE